VLILKSLISHVSHVEYQVNYLLQSINELVSYLKKYKETLFNVEA
jgi:hypothetical protein